MYQYDLVMRIDRCNVLKNGLSNFTLRPKDVKIGFDFLFPDETVKIKKTFALCLAPRAGHQEIHKFVSSHPISNFVNWYRKSIN